MAPITETKARPIPRVARELMASSGFLLARLGLGFKARALTKVEEAGFELYDYSVLAILDEGVRETQGVIAGTLGVDPSRLVALIDSLEERGLVARQRDPHDRRRYVVSITDAGRRELDGLRRVVRELEEEYFAPLGAEERKTLHDLLFRLAERHDPACAFKGDHSSGAV